MDAGLGRLRNAAHAMITALCAFAVAAIVYFLVGRLVQGDGSPLQIWISLVGAGLAAVIPLGSGMDRWRLSAVCLSTAILAGVTLPVFARWTWGGGWLAQLGYVDPGGSGVIHAVGGITALAIVWTIGPRRGKYGAGAPMAIPGHHAVFVLFGCFISLIGWLGFNAAGSILFAGVKTDGIALIAVNTILSASGAGLATALVTRFKYGKPDATLTANGWTSGLVASSASCAFAPPVAAVLIGVIAGGFVTFAVELLDVTLEIDDPAGSISVHALGGIWGVLSVGLFARGNFVAQVAGVATLVGFILPLAWGANALLNLVWKQRVSLEGEQQGLDLHELGAGAYPEFITHSDEHMPR